jgi:Ca-activated chloride channel homolog
VDEILANLNQLHFACPLCLGGILVIPLIWTLFLLFYQRNPAFQLEKFIDPHLLPYLRLNKPKKASFWKTLLLWSFVWMGLTLALAGPRWSFREVETFTQDQSLVLLLDLSESMNATDVKPSRLIRAKQKIEDLLNLSKGVKIGLIAFAADSHMLAPITDDKETLRHLLPSIDTELVYIQGSRLTAALEMAATMLEAEPGHNKALLVISDGGFEDASAILNAKKLAEKEIVIHVMGVGTESGATFYKNNTPIVSKLEKERLNEISKIGRGRYLEAHYSDHEEAIILKELEKRAEAQETIGKKNRFWEEHFYVMIIPLLPIMLGWFRKGAIFAALCLFLIPSFKMEATFADYFKNSEELGKLAFDEGDYAGAIDVFQDPYRKGVACYRANNFAQAEEHFRESNRPEVAAEAAYNLGNSQVKQQKFEEAIKTYEDLLTKWPDHQKAKENLEIVKKLLQENQNSEQNQNQNQKENQEKDQEQSQDQSQDQSRDQDQSKDQSQKRDQNHNQKDEQNNQRSDSQNPANTENQKQNEPFDQEEETQRPEQNEKQPQGQNPKESPARPQEAKAAKSQEDLDADEWLNRITNDQKNFLKNKFFIESKRNGTTEGIDPW